MSVCVVIREKDEALALKAFGLRVSAALEEKLEIWLAGSTPFKDEVLEELGGLAVEDVLDFSGTDRKRKILNEAKSKSPRLLIIGKSMESSSDEHERRFSTDIFEHVECQVMAVRVSDELAMLDKRILVPCAGGRHSQRALKLASAMAGDGTVAFQMRAPVDELSEEVGHRHLRKMLKRAGLNTDDILTRVRVGDRFEQALSEEILDDSYGMLLIGASHSGTLRRKLFGTLPERVLSGEQGMTVGVIRAERSKGSRLRKAVARLIHVTVPQLNRLERLALFDEVESKSRWNFDFAALMILATAIAGMGLLANSGAVVIGAMLVAPLMMPLIGTGLSLVQGNWPLAGRAMGAVGSGFVFAFLLSVIMGLVARFLNLGLTEQLRMRGEPNSLDLGIAFVSGIAASYCIARPKLTGALAGVAIAAALVPPIATVGIGLAMGQTTVAFGAALLFGTNIVAIVLGAGLNFKLAGISGNHRAGAWGRRSLIALVLVCLALAVPLTSVLLSKLSHSEGLEKAIQSSLPEGVSLDAVNRMKNGGFEVILESATPLSEVDLQKVAEAVSSYEKEGGPVKLRTNLVHELTL